MICENLKELARRIYFDDDGAGKTSPERIAVLIERKMAKEVEVLLLKLLNDIWNHPHVFYERGAKAIRCTDIEDLVAATIAQFAPRQAPDA